MNDLTSAAKEPPRLLADAIYIDASVYRALCFDWDGRQLAALGDLIKRGLLRLITTDINKREVAARLREVWMEAARPLKASSIALQQMGLGECLAALADEEACFTKMVAAFDAWLKRNRAWLCKHEPAIGDIMRDYFDTKPPFGTGKKKHEFPDAVVAAQLRLWCEFAKQKVYVVSQDRDLKACCSPDGPLIHAASIAEVISHAKVTVVVHNAVSELIRQSDTVFSDLREQAEYLKVGVEPGYIGPAKVTVDVRGVKLRDGSIEEVTVSDFDGTNMTCDLLFYGELELKAEVDQEEVQYGEDDWDPGSRHIQIIRVQAPLHAAAAARLNSMDPLEIVIDRVELDDSRIELEWSDVRHDIA